MSVLSKHGGLAPLRVGFWREKAPGKPAGYIPDALLCAVEPVTAQLLELSRLAAFGEGLTYAPSRNRQCHLYAVTQRRDPRSLALKRVFVRCQTLLLHMLPVSATSRESVSFPANTVPRTVALALPLLLLLLCDCAAACGPA